METHEMSAQLPSVPGETGILEKGTVLQDRYEILGLRAVGGMGAVYEARDRRFAHTLRRCAVKEILNIGADAKTRQLNLRNFEREANILASLSHPSIPSIFDYFIRGSRAYLVLEYVEGQDLDDLLEHSEDIVSEERALRWALQICDVLDYLHSYPDGPIVFRDVKPSNIMLCANDRIMLVDFGIAKVFADQKKGTMVGTEGYSPPEQYRGISVPQGDIYALGASLHHILTHQDPRLHPPFTFHERPIREANPSVSGDTEALVAKCLEYEIEKRFASIAELRSAIVAALGEGSDKGGHMSAAMIEAAAPTHQLAWQFTCEDEVRSSPMVHNGVLYIGAYDNNLYALDASSGRFLWKYPTEGGICVTPCAENGKLLFGSEDQIFYALSERTGRITWSCPTDGRIRSSAMAAYGHVFFGSDDGRLYGANIDSGRVIWKFQAGGSIRCRPLLVEEIIVFVSEDAQIYAVDMGSGELRWRQRANRGMVSSPCLGEGLIYVGSRDWHLYAYNARSGWPVWRFRTNNMVISSPALAGNLVVFGSTDSYLYAVDAKSGRLQWRFQTDGQIVSSPAIYEDGVYFGSADGHVYGLDAKTGRERWRFQARGPITSSPWIEEGLLHIGSIDGHIYALFI